jgi:hypothetical protein
MRSRFRSCLLPSLIADLAGAHIGFVGVDAGGGEDMARIKI